MAKVKVQVDLTKERPSHIWIDLDEEDIIQRSWHILQYKGVPDHCSYCKHQRHMEHACTIKQRDKESKKKEQEAEKKNKNKVESLKKDQDMTQNK